MIRPFTCLTVLLAAGSGLYLYSEKHRTTLLDDRIRVVVTDTHRIEDRTAMLRAEWALLNQPDRLGALAAKFLPALQPIAPTQFVQMADLDRHLPPVGPPPAPPSASPAPAPAIAAPPPPVALASAVVPLPTRPVPAPTAAAATPTPVRVAVAHHAPAPAAPHHRVLLASAAPARPRATRTVDPVREAAYVPRPAVAGWRPVAAAPAIAAPAAYTGSALGMAGGASIAPPMAAAN